MRRYFTRRNVLLFIVLVLLGGFYIHNLLPKQQEAIYAYIPAAEAEAESQNGSAAAVPGEDGNAAPGDTVTPAPSAAPEETEAVLSVRDTVISLGESEGSLIDKLGKPGRIDATEYDFNYYVYDNDYSRLLYVAVREGRVVGYYSDSLDFDYRGISSGSDIKTVRKALNSDFPMSDVITADNQDYTVHILLDQLITHKVTGIYVLDNSVKIDEYTEEVMKNIAHMVYDLTNSIRVRNDRSILSWSSSAALASRKHCFNMAENNFFSHSNPERQNAGDRLRAEGIYYQTHAENIIAGYGTAILSTHRWFNSTVQRDNMLSKKFRCLGVGFAYLPDSTYQTYITQNFYR
jgi:uncharacterized protein YkwD